MRVILNPHLEALVIGFNGLLFRRMLANHMGAITLGAPQLPHIVSNPVNVERDERRGVIFY